MSHFGDVVWNVLSLVGLGTTLWFGVVCWRKASHALQDRIRHTTLKQQREKWQKMPVEAR